jgi:hypothetical protein
LEQDQIPQVFNAIDKQQVMSFIEKNAPIPGLDVQVAKLAMYVVETCPRRVNLTALTQQLLRTVEDCVYTATLASWPQDFVGTAQWPPLRTKVDPHAVATLKESTIQVRNDTLKAIYNRYQTETKCDKPMYVPESGYMHWLSDGEFYKMNPFCPENWVPEPILPHSAPLNPHVLGSGTPMHFCV